MVAPRKCNVLYDAGQVYAAVGRCDGSITVYDALGGSIVAEIEGNRCKSKEKEDRWGT